MIADAGMTAAGLLAAVLVWAGVAKLQRGQETEAGFAALGVPRPEIAARGVPIAEVLVAVALIALPPLGGALALLLLGAFTWLVVVRLRSGSAVPCACFGQPHAPPLSTTEVVRNGVLAVLGVLAVFGGRAHVPGPRGILMTCGLALMGLALLSHLRSTRTGPVSPAPRGRSGPTPPHS